MLQQTPSKSRQAASQLHVSYTCPAQAGMPASRPDRQASRQAGRRASRPAAAQPSSNPNAPHLGRAEVPEEGVGDGVGCVAGRHIP